MADSEVASRIINGLIDDPFNPKVEEVGKFAVKEYNELEQEKRLEFVKVLQAQLLGLQAQQLLYRLFIEAKHDDDDGLKRYEALVYVKPLMGYMKLLEFNLVEQFDPVIIGGWTDAGNDVGIEDLAKFAVDEYNKKERTTLEFTKLKHAQKQLVAGILYRLTLEAIDNGHKKLYQAMVIVIPWKEIKELKDFKPLLLKVEG